MFCLVVVARPKPLVQLVRTIHLWYRITSSHCYFRGKKQGLIRYAQTVSNIMTSSAKTERYGALHCRHEISRTHSIFK
jgi:hypothetical protein